MRDWSKSEVAAWETKSCAKKRRRREFITLASVRVKMLHPRMYDAGACYGMYSLWLQSFIYCCHSCGFCERLVKAFVRRQ